MSDRRTELATDWLARVLGSRAFSVEPASEDASFRRYLRVRTCEQTLVLMDAPPEHEPCAPFVRTTELLRKAGVNAPRIHHADLERGLLLLDDLGATHYLDRLPDEAPRLYADALATLVTIQQVPAADLDPYDARRLDVELGLLEEWLLGRHLGIALDARGRVTLAETCRRLVEVCLEQPQVFVHRDYHSRNLMVVEGANPGVLDHQGALRGPIAYDLASLLRDVYHPLAGAQVSAWVDRYRTRAVAAGLLEPDAGIARWVDLTGAQRHLKIAGLFARLHYRDGKPGYLDDIPLALTYLREELAPWAEGAALARLLDELGVARRVADANARERRAVRAGG